MRLLGLFDATFWVAMLLHVLGCSWFADTKYGCVLHIVGGFPLLYTLTLAGLTWQTACSGLCRLMIVATNQAASY